MNLQIKKYQTYIVLNINKIKDSLVKILLPWICGDIIMDKKIK